MICDDQLFPNVPGFNDAMAEMVTEINGFVYAGERLEAYIETIKWLRGNPVRAAYLLGDFSNG